MTGKRNPGALAGAAGAMVTVQAALLNVTTSNSTIPGELHHVMEQSHLRRRHGLSGPRSNPTSPRSSRTCCTKPDAGTRSASRTGWKYACCGPAAMPRNSTSNPPNGSDGSPSPQLHAICSEVYGPDRGGSRRFLGTAAVCPELDISVGPKIAGCPVGRLARAILKQHPDLADTHLVPGRMRDGEFVPTLKPLPVASWAELSVSEGDRPAHFVKYRSTRTPAGCAAGGAAAPRAGSGKGV